MKAVFALALLPLASAFDPEDAGDLLQTVLDFDIGSNTEVNVCVCRKYDSAAESMDIKEPSGGYTSVFTDSDPCPVDETCADGYTADRLQMSFLATQDCDGTTYNKISTGITFREDKSTFEWYEMTFDHGAKLTVDSDDDNVGVAKGWGWYMYFIHDVSDSNKCGLDIDVVAPILECSDATGDKETYQTMGCCDC